MIAVTLQEEIRRIEEHLKHQDKPSTGSFKEKLSVSKPTVLNSKPAVVDDDWPETPISDGEDVVLLEGAPDAPDVVDLDEPVPETPAVKHIKVPMESAAQKVTTSKGDTEVKDENKTIIFLYRPECLQCSFLVHGAERAYKKCHYLSGNDACPAKHVRMMEGMKTDLNLVAKSIARAMLNADAIKISQKMRKLRKFDELIQKKVMAKVMEIVQTRPN